MYPFWSDIPVSARVLQELAGHLSLRRGAQHQDPRPDRPSLSPVLYRRRNAIERMFARLEDFRRIATRYDRRAQNFLAAVCLVATVCYWL